jgi:hypothetical protein
MHLFRASLPGLGFLAATGLVAPAFAAATFPLDHFNLTSGPKAMTPGSYGMVSLTQDGSDVDVLVQLASDEAFAHSNKGASFYFDLNLGTIGIEDLSDGFALKSTTAGLYHAGLVSTFDYEIYCNVCKGSGGIAGPLSFTLVDVSVADFIQNDHGYYFSSSVCLGVTANGLCADGAPSGNLTASFDPPSPMPEPATVALFGAGLLGLGGPIGFYRRRKKLWGR